MEERKSTKKVMQLPSLKNGFLALTLSAIAPFKSLIGNGETRGQGE